MDHTVVHFDVPVDDPERAIEFYRELFGWEISRWGGEGVEPAGSEGMEYWLVSTVPTDGAGNPTRPGVNGGLTRRLQPGQPAVNYISVESVADYSVRVEGLGGEVVAPKTPIPGVGWYAFVKDTEGNLFGLFETDRGAGSV